MDYREFYHLNGFPFSGAPDERFFYNCPQQEKGHVRVLHAVETMRGLALVVGEIGTGKTTLAQRVLASLPEDRYEAALLVVTTPMVTPDWFLRRLAAQLCRETPEKEYGALIDQLCKRLIHVNAEGRKTVVLLDEANMLTHTELLAGIRGLLNVEIDGEKLITFVLFGLPELDRALQNEPALRQRVALRYCLEPLSREDTLRYTRFRLEVAGRAEPLFTDEALNLLWDFSGGIPRVVNNLSDIALLEGALAEKGTIGPEEIREAAAGLGLEGIGSVERVSRI